MNEPMAAPRWRGRTLSLQTADGVILSVGHVPPQAPARPEALIIVHGIASHMAWYEDVANALAGLGFEVFVPDRRGSGASGGPRGHAPSWHHLCQDLSAVVALAQRAHPRPIHLLGVSLGAVVALATALKFGPKVASLFLATPALDTRQRIRRRTKLRTFVRALVRPQSQKTLPFAPGDLTPCTEEQARVESDALRLTAVSARMALAIFCMRRYVHRHLRELKLPTALLFASEDRLVDNDRVLGRFADADPPHLWVETYESVPHFLHGAVPAELLARHVTEWIESGAAGQGPGRRTTRRTTRNGPPAP